MVLALQVLRKYESEKKKRQQEERRKGAAMWLEALRMSEATGEKAETIFERLFS